MPGEKSLTFDKKITKVKSDVERLSLRLASEKEEAYLLSQGDNYEEYHKVCEQRENTKSELCDAESELSALMRLRDERKSRISQEKSDKADHFVNSAIIFTVVFAIVYFISRYY
ncbi:hypothetical protein [Morganella morganii]|uniref:hypothetical protein n=1 Tax=Morganella morganii TaxID=582 RepID=UPI00128E78C5|nr:hypothetical protein [Morganella morganii]MQC08096.1 hypothetical protein [Morganella morganii]MQC10048.1 hypothetical protein [Morganella morganii]MQC13287.1 hypothetical protein [Morganella morganii]